MRCVHHELKTFPLSLRHLNVKVRLTVAAATMFVARAQLAKKVVEERKDESGVAAMYVRRDPWVASHLTSLSPLPPLAKGGTLVPPQPLPHLPPGVLSRLQHPLSHAC